MIENLAVVERLRLRFGAGLNVLTGETGSGKSIVVDALNLLFGGRASAEIVRSGTPRTRVAGIFELPPAAKPLLEAAGIETEDDELLIEREVSSAGKSRAFIANRPVTAALLRDLAPMLGDVHGQHDQQQLFLPSAQLAVLDTFAGVSLDRVSAVYREWREVQREADELDRNEQEKLRLLDLWSFQRKEIDNAALKPNEDAELDNERRVLQNVTKILETASGAYDALYEAESSAYAQVRSALRRLEDLSRIDESLTEVAEALKPAQIAVNEASATLRDYLGKLEADPGRLEEVESRLATIDKLKRKYGATVEEILVFRDKVAEDIAGVEGASERRAELRKKSAELEASYDKVASELTGSRMKAARKIEKAIESELNLLAMSGTRFVVETQETEPGPQGRDAVRFLISANTGEEPRPLDRIASGGELSRIALALKTCVTGRVAGTGRTLVFDEVDAGIGGSAGEVVGRKLKQSAAGDQVLCVTHLAQIAGFADHHFAVEKRTTQGRTVAQVEELTGEARTREIGRMLSGQRLTPEVLKHAEQLLQLGAGN